MFQYQKITEGVLSPYLTTVHCGYKMYCVIWFKMAAHNRPLPSKTSTATLKIVMGEKTLHFLSHWYEIAPSKLSREAFKGLDLHLGLLCKWILWGASLSKKKVIVSWNLTERKSSSSKFRDCLIWIVFFWPFCNLFSKATEMPENLLSHQKVMIKVKRSSLEMYLTYNNFLTAY